MTVNRDYTRISYDKTLNELLTILSHNQGALADVSKGSYGRTLLELFSASADMSAEFTENSFTESWLESAKSTEANYVGARSLGYSVRRPVPSKAQFAISLKRTGNYSNVRISIPRGTTFEVGGVIVTALDDCEFLYDRTSSEFENGLLKLTSGTPVVAEGYFVEQNFISNNTKNQEFLINDSGFSEWYGENDPKYVESMDYQNRKNLFCTVISQRSSVDKKYVVDGYEDKVIWNVSRFGYSDAYNKYDPYIDDYGVISNDNYTVKLVTANNGNVMMKFGDGISASIPKGNITVKYFKTLGYNGRRIQISSTEMKTSANNIGIYQSNGKQSDLTLDDFKFIITTDLTGGLDIEDIDSIKRNASSIFSSLNRLTNMESYKAFLSRNSSLRYSIAYGEDVLKRIKNRNIPTIKYSNIVRFTGLKDLYITNGNNIYPANPYEYSVSGYKVNGLMYLWQYDYQDLPTKKEFTDDSKKVNQVYNGLGNTIVVNGETYDKDSFIQKYLSPLLDTSYKPDNIFNAQIQPLDMCEIGSELHSLLNIINTKGYITLGGGQHAYVPPVVHEYTVKATVLLYEGAIFSDVRNNIKKRLYNFLKSTTEFSKPIFNSKLQTVVDTMTEVKGVNLQMVPIIDPIYSNYDLTLLPFMDSKTSVVIRQVGIDVNGFDVKFQYEYQNTNNDGSLSTIQKDNLTFTVKNIKETQKLIDLTIKDKLLYLKDGLYLLKTNLSEDLINNVCGFIWSTAMNNVYNSLYEIYQLNNKSGKVLAKNKVKAIIESIKTWSFDGSVLKFNAVDGLVSLSENEGTNLLFNYITYILEYIKLVRKVTAHITAKNLLDVYGNITNYSEMYEIVQFNINNDDIDVKYFFDKIVEG